MASNGRRSGYPEESARASDRVDIPSHYRSLPQPIYIEPYSPTGYRAGPVFPPIQFQRKDDGVPYTVEEILKMKEMPDLVGGSDPVFVALGDRIIKIKTIVSMTFSA